MRPRSAPAQAAPPSPSPAPLGARVVIVEKDNCFGGIATTATVSICHSLRDTEGKRRIIAGLKIYLHTRFAAPLFEHGRLLAIAVEHKPGRGAIRARVFIDATVAAVLAVDAPGGFPAVSIAILRAKLDAGGSALRR